MFIHMITQALLTIKDHFFLSWFALLLFILGFAFSWIVERYNLTIFKVLPIWFLKKTLRYASPERNFLQVFLFIFLFNSTAIFIYMLTGAFIVFPFIIAFITGTNVGIISLQPVPPELEETTIYRRREMRPGIISLLGVLLVPLLEISAFSISMAMGMAMGIGMYLNFSLLRLTVLVLPRIFAYLIVIIPILFVSALLEAGAIKDLQKINIQT